MGLNLILILTMLGIFLTGASFGIGIVVGKQGAYRILRALEDNHYRAELFAIRATRQRLKESALAINHEMDCHSALEIARRAYNRQKD